MCVSAEASFGLTGLLVPVGISCMRNANQRDRSSLPIAMIPLVFGIQQFFEGLVWVGIGRGNAELTRLTATGYLFFALTFWLFWIPFSAMFLEERRVIQFVLGLGAVFGLMGGAVLFFPIVSNPESLLITVVHHSLRYDYPEPPALRIAPEIWHLFYVAVISMPLILLKNKRLIGFSTALVVSAVISHVYFYYSFASIWCFFAAFLSIYLAYLFHNWPLPLLKVRAST